MPYNWDKPIIIRDGRNGEWYWVQKEVLASDKLFLSDKVVYSALAYYANNKTQQAYPRIRTIANLLKISKTTVQKSIKKLLAYKLISIQKVNMPTGRTNAYTLLKVPMSDIVVPNIGTSKVVPVNGTSQEVVSFDDILVPVDDGVVPVGRAYSRTNNNNEQELNNNRVLSLEESQERIQLIKDKLKDYLIMVES